MVSLRALVALLLVPAASTSAECDVGTLGPAAMTSLCSSLPASTCSTLASNATLAAVCSTHCVPEPEPVSDIDENVGLAFGLVTAAGMSTTIGASVVFFEGLGATLSNHGFLGGSLGFSAGVMVYVSMAEIFVKSQAHFGDCDCLWDDEGSAYVMATLMFFSGIVLTWLLDFAVSCIDGKNGGHGHSHGPGEECGGAKHVAAAAATDDGSEGDSLAIENGCECCEGCGDGEEGGAGEAVELHAVSVSNGNSNGSGGAVVKEWDSLEDADAKDQAALSHMGLMTALAIGLHNFPEGLATFVATLDDPTVGAALAVAIAVHNVPEGMCVAIPIYYATGSKWKGFWVALFSGVTEVVGAGLGYGFLKATGAALGDGAYGALFGLVAGMMVAISIKELLPTARRYDKEDKYVSISFMGGCFVMAASLCLFVA